MAMKKKCKRGTMKTVVVPLIASRARRYIMLKGSKGMKSLLKQHLVVTTCTREGGFGTLLKKVAISRRKKASVATKVKRKHSKRGLYARRVRAIRSRGRRRGRRFLGDGALAYTPMSTSLPTPPPPVEV
jgi:hypothetical protein